MHCINRYNQYKDDDLDQILLRIKNGTIKSGRYSHMVKIDKNYKIKGKEFFKDGKDKSE